MVWSQANRAGWVCAVGWRRLSAQRLGGRGARRAVGVGEKAQGPGPIVKVSVLRLPRIRPADQGQGLSPRLSPPLVARLNPNPQPTQLSQHGRRTEEDWKR